jgi:hypothetical protein
MVPTVAFPPAISLTDQVTPVLVVPVRIAVNCICPETFTVADGRLMETFTACGAGAVESCPPQDARMKVATVMLIATRRERLSMFHPLGIGSTI